jgi:two-component system LytT family sensor kinase
MLLKFNKLSKPELLKHIISWILFCLLFQLLNPVHGNIMVVLKGVLVFVFRCMLVYYIVLLVILPSFWEENHLLLILSLGLMYLGFLFFEYLNISNLLASGEIGIAHLLMDALLLSGLIWFTAFSSYTNRRANEKVTELNEKQKVLVINELNSLKRHFSSNVILSFLDFIRDEVSDRPGRAIQAIDLFSKIIRYSFETEPGDYVSLENEIEYISNYIGLHKCLNEAIRVDFKWKGNAKGSLVYPRILISFVENAFKHGLIDDPDKPITIQLSALPKCIVFEVGNEKNLLKKNRVSGFGDRNMRLILDLLYSHRYTLQIANAETKYFAKLVLIS